MAHTVGDFETANLAHLAEKPFSFTVTNVQHTIFTTTLEGEVTSGVLCAGSFREGRHEANINAKVNGFENVEIMQLDDFIIYEGDRASITLTGEKDIQVGSIVTAESSHDYAGQIAAARDYYIGRPIDGLIDEEEGDTRPVFIIGGTVTRDPAEIKAFVAFIVISFLFLLMAACSGMLSKATGMGTSLFIKGGFCGFIVCSIFAGLSPWLIRNRRNR